MKKVSEKILITNNNIHLMFFTCFYISVRMLDDEVFSIDYYSKIGGISTKRLNEMENAVLETLDYKIFINALDFDLIESN